MKYKVGDWVTIRKDLMTKTYGEHGVIDEMLKFKGKRRKINCVCGSSYRLENGEGWAFTDEMFEDNNDENEIRAGDVVERIAEDFEEIKKGERYIVSEVNGGNINLKDYSKTYCLNYFKKVNSQYTIIEKDIPLTSTSEIKVGDKLKRIKNFYYNMEYGDIFTVKTIINDTMFYSEERALGLNIKNFCLYNTQQNVEKGEKMEIKIETEMEKKALIQAKEQEITRRINEKAEGYRREMQTFISYELEAKRYRQMADDLKKKLGITDKEMKDIF